MDPRGLCLGLILCLSGLCALPAQAQGRYEGVSEAEKLLRRGQELEGDADARKQSRPAESRELYQEALELYREALEEDPGLLDAYVRLGYAHYALGQPQEAADALAPAIARWPQSARLRRVYGTVLFGLKGRRQEAVGHLEAAAAATPDAFDVFFLLGKHHYEAENWPQAARWLRKYLSFAQEDASAHGTMGNIYLRLDKLEPALGEFRLVQSLEPGNLSAQVNIANIRFRQRRYPEAIALFQEVLAKKPDVPEARFNLASAFYEEGRYPEALESWRAFLKLRPGHPGARYMIGLSLIEQESYPEAREVFTALLQDQPEMARAHWRLGLLELRRGQAAQARAHLERACALDPRDAWFFKGLGDALRSSGELELALARHKEARALAPGEPLMVAAMGRDAALLGDLPQAAAWTREALRLDAKNPALRDLHAVILLRLAHQRLAEGAQPGEASLLEVTQELLSLEARPVELWLLRGALALQAQDLELAQQAVEVLRPMAQGLACSPELCLPAQIKRLEGLVWLARGDFARARSSLEALLDPKGATRDPVVAQGLGLALAAQERWAQALPWLVQAWKQGADKERAGRNLGLASLRVAQQQGQQGHWRQALELLEGAEAQRAWLLPQEQVALDLAWSVAHAETNAGPKALASLRAVRARLDDMAPQQRQSLPSDEALALDLRQSWLLYRLGQPDRAAALLERSPDRKGPRARDAEKLLVALYLEQASKQHQAGRLPQARELLRKAQKAHQGRDPVIEHNLAVLEFERKPNKKAGEVFRKYAGRLDAAVFNEAVFLEWSGDMKAAVQRYEQAARRGVQKEVAERRVEARRRVFGQEAP